MAFAQAKQAESFRKDTESYNGCFRNYSEGKPTVENNGWTVKRRRVKTSADPSISQALTAAFWRRVDRSGDCWLWTGKTRKHRSHRYGYLWNPDNQTTEVAHRFAWRVQFGPIPDGLRVLHQCDNPRCLRAAHLFLGTPLDNMRDMAAKGRRSPLAHARKGKTFSAEHRAALSVSQRRRHAKNRAERGESCAA